MNSMIDQSSVSRFSTGVPVSAIRGAAGMRPHRLAPAGCAAFLMFCASSQTTPRPRDLRQRLPVPGGDAVGGDDEVGSGDSRG